MRGTRLIAIGTAVALSACAPILSAVRMHGESSDLAALTGKWNGEYRSPELGRSGSIVFRFADPQDVGYGDVAMLVPEGATYTVGNSQTWVRPRFHSEILKIKFVNVVNGEVFGVLEPYTDPSCECIVRTTFTGRFDGVSTIRGTFATTSAISSTARTGTWKVVKQ